MRQMIPPPNRVAPAKPARNDGRRPALAGRIVTSHEGEGGGGWFEERDHVLPLRVFYEDTDAAGIVYYANYLKFAERGRTELMRCLGFAHRQNMTEYGIGIVVRDCQVSYLQPARLDDAILVHSRVTELRRVSFHMQQTVLRQDDGEVLVRLAVRLAVVGRDLQPTRLPQPIHDALAAHVVAADTPGP